MRQNLAEETNGSGWSQSELFGADENVVISLLRLPGGDVGAQVEELVCVRHLTSRSGFLQLCCAAILGKGHN